jgi:nicotinate-nucleotide adenylyltransferase
MAKIGLLFGSFNPVHFGHIGIAEKILETAIVDEIWFVLSPQNPFKSNLELLDDKKRLEILNLALENYSEMKVSEIEINMEKPSYTYKTLKKIQFENPRNEFLIIIGADILENFDKWKNYEEIINNYSFIIYPRHKISTLKIYDNMRFVKVEADEIDVSSTQIREKIKLKQDIFEYLPKKVVTYILENSLYSEK